MEKSDLNDVMICLLKDLKAIYSVNVSYVCCDNAGENEAFK